MDITERRRENLRRWVAENGVPPKEKSLFSQLKSAASFGEKLARRLEDQYRMGMGYLDQLPRAANLAGSQSKELPAGVHYEIITAEEKALLDAYRTSTRRGRDNILLAADRAERDIPGNA
jgi:hypothetical protein